MGLLEKLILGLIIIALPLGEIARFSLNEVAISLLDIWVGITVFCWLFLRRKIPSSNLKRPLFIFTATLFISLLMSMHRLNTNEILVSFLYLIRWIFYAILFFIVLDLSSKAKKVSKAMIMGGTIIVGIGFVQYFLYPDLRNLFYAGWDEHLFRMFTWTFLDPNFAGIFFVLFFLFSIKKLLKKPTLFLKLLSALTLIAIILTFSRSAYISLVIGVFSLLFLKRKRMLGIGLIVLFIIGTLAIAQISLRSEGTDLLRTASGEARLDSMKNAITIFKDYPILGVGFNSYRYAQEEYGFLDESKMIVHSGAGTDNSFLFILATSGVVGFTALLYLLFKIISIKEPLIVSSIIALIVNSLFINSLFYPPIMLWMWLILGLRKST